MDSDETRINNRFISYGLLLIGLCGIGVSIWQFFIPSSFYTRLLVVSLTIILSIIILIISRFSFSHPEKFWSVFRSFNPFLWVSLAYIDSFLLCGILVILLTPKNKLGMPSILNIYLRRLMPHVIWLGLICAFILCITLLFYYFPIIKNKQKTINSTLKNNRKQLVLLLSFLILCLYFFYQTPGARIGGDSDDYLYMAQVPLFSPEFYSGPRPPTTGFVYKILGAELSIMDSSKNGDIVTGFPAADRIRIFQYLLHACSWGIFALIVGGLFQKKPCSLIIMLMVYMVALSPTVMRWNNIILSESISISLMVLLFSLLLHLATNWQWTTFYAIILIAFLWMNSRETNALLVLCSIPFLMIGLFLNRTKIFPLFYMALLLIFSFFITSHFSEMRNRWVIPFINVVYQRILDDKMALNEFLEYGMPVNSDVLEMKGKWACDNNCAVYKDPKYSDFWNWSREFGKRYYIKFLVKHPTKSLIEPFKHLENLLATYPPEGLISSIFVIPIWSIVYLKGFEPITLLLYFGMCGYLIIKWWQSGKQNTITALLVIFSLLLLPHLFFSYHGDAMEIRRHAIQASIQMHLMFWILMFYILDGIKKIHSLANQKIT